MVEVTVGIDIGTSSVKALAADGDGTVVARTRLPHEWSAPAPGQFEHDAARVWRDAPVVVLDALRADDTLDVRGVCVTAMVPTITAVDRSGTPVTPGLLYGDERGRDSTGAVDMAGMAKWAAGVVPDAHGLWPAQAVASHALAGVAVIDSTVAGTAIPLSDFVRWDANVAAELGVRVDQLPDIVGTGQAAGRVGAGRKGVGRERASGPVLASGCVDAVAEQLVAGADRAGDVLVMLGTTLIVWVVSDRPVEVPGAFTVPHTVPGLHLVGSPSDAGGLFAEWATRLLDPGARAAPPGDPARVPVWLPYPRGERVGSRAIDRRAVLADLDLTHDAASVVRAAYEATGFAVRRIVDAARAAGADPKRVVMSGGGTHVDGWVQAVADAARLPVTCALVPEGAALGGALLARIASGLAEPSAMNDSRWARTGRSLEPDPAWVEPVAERYERFLALY